MRHSTIALALALPVMLSPLAASAIELPKNGGSGVVTCTNGVCSGGYYQTQGAKTTNDPNFYDMAAGSLSDGKLHALVTTSNDPQLYSYCTILTCGWGSTAEVLIWDTIKINADNHTAGDLVHYSFSIDGQKTRGRWAWGDGAAASAHYYLGADQRGFFSPYGVDLGANNKIESTFTVPAQGTLTLYFLADLWVEAENGSSADYSNTMSFQWDLPGDASFTSASGTFMSAYAPAAVPEPGNAALLAAGLGIVGWLARRRAAPARA